MRELFSPRGVAVVGAGALAGRMVRYLTDHGFPGGVYAVDPRSAGLSALDEPVDLALIAVSANRVYEALFECAAKGIRYAVVHASGFSEVGPAGAALQADALSLARDVGIRLLGPNCIGLVSTPDRLVAGFSPLFSRAEFRPGNIALVAQSGALGFGIASLGLERGLGFSRIINTGNEADICSAELVWALIEDEATGVILVYSEGLKEGPAWRELGALAHSRGKPVIILKAGRSEAGGRAAASHTAALAGDDQVWEAAFRQLGYLRVADVEEMLDLAAAFAQPRRPAGRRLGVLTTSGGAGILAADAAAGAKLHLPELTGSTRAELEQIIPKFGSAANPVDVTAQVISDRELFRRALRTLTHSHDVESLVACFCVLQGEEAERVVDDLIGVHGETAKPLLVSRTGAEELAPGAAGRLRAAGIPVYPTPARAAAAAGALAAFAAWRPPAAAMPSAQPRAKIPWPFVAQQAVNTEAEAVEAAEQLGYPVVLKLNDPAVAHKTEVGGVFLNIRSPEALRNAYEKLEGRPCLVQKQVENPVAEMLVGIAPTPLGPMVTAGLGGIFAEALGDVARRLAPVTPAEAGAMLAELKGYPLLTGARGRPKADLRALADLISQVSYEALAWPEGTELDLNPVMALPDGALIVDSLFVQRREPPDAHR